MKQRISKRGIRNTTLFFAPATFLFLFFLFCSFTAQKKMEKYTDDFLKQLGIAKGEADEKIGNSILGGYLSIDGVKNAKNIALGNRRAVTLDLLGYTKKYVNSTEFIKKYKELKSYYKPKEAEIETPEQFKASTIANYKKFVEQAEESLKKANDQFKSIFQQNLEDAKKRLKEAEDPNYKPYVNYNKNYPQLVKNYKESYNRQIADWNEKYPENHLLFVKQRLLQFLEETKEVDFSAELVEKGNKKYFVNPDYERKSNRWKMAYRAGKEVVEPAREFVQQWINEIR